MKLTLADGKIYDLQAKQSIDLVNLDLAGTYGNGTIDYGAEEVNLKEAAPGLGYAGAVAVVVNGVLKSIDTSVKHDCTVDFIMIDHEAGMAMSNRAAIVLLSYTLQALPYAVMRQGGNVNEDGTIAYTFIVPEGKILCDDDKALLQQELNHVLEQQPQLKNRVLPYYPTMKTLQGNNEAYLIESIRQEDDGMGPIDAVMWKAFFEPMHDLVLEDCGRIKAIELIAVTQEANMCKIIAKIALEE